MLFRMLEGKQEHLSRARHFHGDLYSETSPSVGIGRRNSSQQNGDTYTMSCGVYTRNAYHTNYRGALSPYVSPRRDARRRCVSEYRRGDWPSPRSTFSPESE